MKEKKTLKRDLIVNELRLVAQQNGGKLRPKDGVEFARKHPNSALHGCLTWNDGEAAEKWRLHQMRNIINVTVQLVLIGGKEFECPAFISFRDDRKIKGGGYTPMVMTQQKMREQMLAEALLELQAFEAKYAALEELCDAISRVRKQFVGKKTGKKKPVKSIFYRIDPTDRPQPPAQA